jgi:SPP1 gp7 family putative phage head morphogenesis protein
VDWERMVAEGRRVFPPYQIRIYSQAMGTSAELANIKTPFNVKNRAAIEWSRQHVTPFMQDLADSTRQGIQRLVTESLERGLSTRNMAREVRRLNGFAMNPRQAKALIHYREDLNAAKAKIASALRASDNSLIGAKDRLRGSVPDAWIKQVRDGKFNVDGRVAKEAAKKERYRAEMIARTEVAEAVSAGALEGYKSALLERVRWEAALDACDICIGYDGNVYTLLEADGMQPEHVNCRCTWTPVMADESMVTPSEAKPTEQFGIGIPIEVPAE